MRLQACRPAQVKARATLPHLGIAHLTSPSVVEVGRFAAGLMPASVVGPSSRLRTRLDPTLADSGGVVVPDELVRAPRTTLALASDPLDFFEVTSDVPVSGASVSASAPSCSPASRKAPARGGPGGRHVCQ